jgi:hypothetical protein
MVIPLVLNKTSGSVFFKTAPNAISAKRNSAMHASIHSLMPDTDHLLYTRIVGVWGTFVKKMIILDEGVSSFCNLMKGQMGSNHDAAIICKAGCSANLQQ